MRKHKKLLLAVSIFLVLAITAGALLTILLPHSENADSEPKNGELYVRELLSGRKIEDIESDPGWKDSIVDSTEDYIMVNADRFSFTEEIGTDGGYSYLYYDHDSHEINMIQHNYVTYEKEKTGKEVMEEQIADVQNNIAVLLGNASVPLTLLPRSGEFAETEELTIDEMIEQTVAETHVMYTMFENEGLRYEINILYSNETVYTVVWIYNESAQASADEGHKH